MKRPGIPVVMYHSLGSAKPGWAWNHLVTPLNVFEKHLIAMNQYGWRTISLGDLFVHLDTGAELPKRAVVLTFDDGYLDNYTLAWPLLRKYGHRAVIYASLDFIDPRDNPRPTLEEYWSGVVGRAEVPEVGFLSASEMKRMVESGCVEIQSHAKTHTWYPSSSRIVDFHRPRGIGGYEAPPWLGWNESPHRKYAYFTEDLSSGIPWGVPIHEVRKSLEAPRCSVSSEVREAAVSHVRENGGAEFFERSEWREQLRTVLERVEQVAEVRETTEEFLTRVRSELIESREGLERLTGRPVEFLCWPGGGRRPDTLELAREVGYLSSTTHFCAKSMKNTYGQDCTQTNRIGSGSPWAWRGKVYHRTPPELFIALLEDFAGFPGAGTKLKLSKARALLAVTLGSERGGPGR